MIGLTKSDRVVQCAAFSRSRGTRAAAVRGASRRDRRGSARPLSPGARAGVSLPVHDHRSARRGAKVSHLARHVRRGPEGPQARAPRGGARAGRYRRRFERNPRGSCVSGRVCVEYGSAKRSFRYGSSKRSCELMSGAGFMSAGYARWQPASPAHSVHQERERDSRLRDRVSAAGWSG